MQTSNKRTDTTIARIAVWLFFMVPLFAADAMAWMTWSYFDDGIVFVPIGIATLIWGFLLAVLTEKAFPMN